MIKQIPGDIVSNASTNVSSGIHDSRTPKVGVYNDKISDLLPALGHQKQYSVAGSDMDPPYTKYGYCEAYNRANSRNRTSEAMSRALGFESNRYQGPA